MQVVLRIANGKSNVRKVRLKSDTVIGRSTDCQLKVASSQISRRHCQILLKETTVAIKDLRSANGTFVNGRRIPAEMEVPLTPGTRVMLGPLQFTVEYDLPGSSAADSLIEDDITENSGEPLETSEDFADKLVDKILDSEATVEAAPSDSTEKSPLPSFVASSDRDPGEGIPFFENLSPAAAAPAGDLEQTAYMTNPFAVMESFAEPEAAAPAPPAVPVAVPAAVPVVVPVAAVLPAAPAEPVLPAVQPVVNAPSAPPEIASPAPDFNFGNFASAESQPAVAFGEQPPVSFGDQAPMVFGEQAPVVFGEQASVAFGEQALGFEPGAVDTGEEEVEEEEPAPKPKAEKKGFLQMLGFGRKKTPKPAPEEAAVEEPDEVEETVEEPVAEQAVPQDSPFGAPDGLPSFAAPAANSGNPGNEETPDEALQNLFNNFK